MKVDLICTEANAAVHVTGVLTAEMVGAELACTFDTAWDGLVKLAWCRCGETKLPVALDAEGRGLIPHECMIGGQLLEVGADGWSEDGTLRIPTVWAKCGTVRQSAAGDIEVVPTPGMAVQILGIAQNADKKATEALEIAATAADYAREYAEAAAQSAATAKESEDAANTAASSAASSAEIAAAKEKEAAKSADDAGVAFGAAVTASKDAIAANAAAQTAKNTAVEAAGRAEQAAIDANTNIDELYDWTADRVAPEASAPRADQVLRDNGERIVLSSGYPGFSVYGYRVEEYTGRRISINADSGGYLHAWTDNMSTISGHIIGEAHDGDRIPDNAIRLFVTAYTDNPPVVAVLTNGIAKLSERQGELEEAQTKLKEDLRAVSENVETLENSVNGISDEVDLLMGRREPESYAEVVQIVQSNKQALWFRVGDQIGTEYNASGTKYDNPFDVCDIAAQYELENGNSVNGMMLLQHYANFAACPFDPQEALYDADDELPAGTYTFEVAGDTWLTSENGKIMQITLTKPVPAGGQIVYADTEGYNKVLAGQSVRTYSAADNFTVIETAVLTEVSAPGTNHLGKTDGLGALNHHQAAYRGSGRWATSMLRQYLNTSLPKGAWWTKQSKWDRCSNFATSNDGYMASLPADFVSCCKPVKVQTARNTVNLDGGIDITYDRFFPLSLQQINAAPQVADVEGSASGYYKALAAQDTTGNLDANGSFKQYGTYPDLIKYAMQSHNTARYCWLRSAFRGLSTYAWYVSSSGYVSYASALSGHYCAPACVIC